MAGKRRGKGKAARRQAQMERLATSAASSGEERRRRSREAAARAASVAPSAARWRVPDAGGGSVAVDVVADLLRLGPAAGLRGRDGDALRRLAGRVVGLLEVDAVTASGRSLAEVVTEDAATRAALRPDLDVEALLAGGPVVTDRADRTVRAAEALLERATAHREGRLDLYELVAPVGARRHPIADEVEATVYVAVSQLAVPASADPAVVTVREGWLGVDPVELFLAAGRGLLAGDVRDVGGAALAGWLAQVRRDGGDPRWEALTARAPVDADELLQVSASRAGSDHPDVVGAALVELIAARHPIAPS